MPLRSLIQHFRLNPVVLWDAYSSVLGVASGGDAVGVRSDGEACWG